jgi:hypothetical protein
VEEFIDGRPLTHFELRNPFIARWSMELLAQTNYDPELNHLIRELKEPSSNFSSDFVFDQEKGWFNRYLKVVRPQLQKMDFSAYPRAAEVFKYFEGILRDLSVFNREYEDLFPKEQ